MLVAVGSTNPTKIDPVREVFSYHFKKVTVKGINVVSGIKDQPLNIEEMYQGACNRAKNALKKVRQADYGVGIEGGLNKYGFGWFEQSIVVIFDRKGNIGVGSSGGLVLPVKVIREIHKGKNLEEVIDSLFKTQNIGEGIGMFGIFTKGVVSRSGGVKHGVAFALARFLHMDIYSK